MARSGEWLLGCVGLLLLGGAGRLVYVEYNDGADLRRSAAAQRTAALTIPAQRGDILDVRGRVLAGSTRRPSVFMDPSSIPENDRQFAAYSVAPLFDGVDAEQLLEDMASPANPGFVWVKRHVTEAELLAFQRMRRERPRLRGFGVRYEPRRDYPLGRTAAHVIGFVQRAEQTGLAGIEQAFDASLTGVDGRGAATVDSARRRLESLPSESAAPQDGDSVVLTLDAFVQRIAERRLRDALDTFDAQWGVAVVMDPHAGEVLAMAVEPGFDPAQPLSVGADDAERELLRNRAISDSYEPGSIFKPFVMSAALQDGLVALDETFAINGPSRRFGRRTVNDTHAYSELTAVGIISKSSNIGMGLLADRCGNARLNEYVRRFGFGQVTGLPLPGEHAGLLAPLEAWTDYSTQSIPIGQEVAATPIQLLNAFNAFCNGGLLMQPRIVRGVIGPQGEIREDYSTPQIVRRVLDETVADTFRMTALTEVVSPRGTGRNAILEGYQVFGKTGTAQVARADGRGYAAGHYVGSFMCGAPAEAPRITVLVSIYSVGGRAYYGGVVAAPTAAAIVDETLTYLRTPCESGDAAAGGED